MQPLCAARLPHRPLILLYKGRGWVFKDLYALLYLHLQMRDDSA